jgi:beta-1,4-mannosyltransferase
MSEETFLTFKSKDMTESKPIEMRRNRPFLIVTSTSYTADEDLGLLLHAIENFDHLMMYLGVSFVFAITGTGPMYDEVSTAIADMRERLQNCAIVQVFLSADEYPTFIGCADAGICLHTSSSGLDLPMKVLDLFGVCVPVIAYEYPAISELVTKDSGFLFKGTARLISHLARLFGDSVQGHQILHRHRTFLQNQRSHFRWDEEWNRVVLPLLD